MMMMMMMMMMMRCCSSSGGSRYLIRPGRRYLYRARSIRAMASHLSILPQSSSVSQHSGLVRSFTLTILTTGLQLQGCRRSINRPRATSSGQADRRAVQWP